MAGSLVKTMIKQFLPEIKEKAAPVTEELLISVLDGYNSQLQEGEEKTSIIIENRRGCVLVHVCAMRKDNTVSRKLKRYELPELVELLMSNIDKI